MRIRVKGVSTVPAGIRIAGALTLAASLRIYLRIASFIVGLATEWIDWAEVLSVATVAALIAFVQGGLAWFREVPGVTTMTETPELQLRSVQERGTTS